jgi:hypothetical protein
VGRYGPTGVGQSKMNNDIFQLLKKIQTGLNGFD